VAGRDECFDELGFGVELFDSKGNDKCALGIWLLHLGGRMKEGQSLEALTGSHVGCEMVVSHVDLWCREMMLNRLQPEIST